MDHSDLQSCVAHISIYFVAVHNVLTSPSKKHGRHCFDCFCSRFGNQEMLLSINFHGESILQGSYYCTAVSEVSKGKK